MLRKITRLVASQTNGNRKRNATPAVIHPLERRQLLSASLITVATFSNLPSADPNMDGGTLIADSAGNLYGTAGGDEGNGIVFKVASGSGLITTLATFNGSGNDAQPSGLVMDAAGNLYGETFGQQDSIGAPQVGTVFEVVAGSHSITTVATFNVSNGANPAGGLTIDSVGNLYGTCVNGGTLNAGSVFELPSGSGTIIDLHNFDAFNNDGCYPQNGVVVDSLGNVFGTTTASGPTGNGSVFELAFSNDALTLHGGSYNGEVPGNLTLDASGNLFGTHGGDIVKIPPGGAAAKLATISGNSQVSGPLLLDSAGNLFGEIKYGGDNGEGSLFEVAAGSGTVTTLASFTGVNRAFNTEPERPQGGLVLDSTGNLFGLTTGGGLALGTVFELTQNGSTSASLTATAPAAQSATAGTAQQFSLGSLSASNATAPYTVTVNWGDGSSPTTLVMNTDGVIPVQSHTYVSAGSDTASINVVDSAGHASNTVQFTIAVASPAPVGTVGLTLTVVKSTFPPSLVAGSKLKGSVSDKLDNTTGISIVGPATISLYAIDASGGQTLVGLLKRRLNIKNDKSIAPSIPVQAIALPAGVYTLLPQMSLGTDSAYATSGPTVTIAAAYVTLSASMGVVKPVSVAVNKAATVLITISNGGNVNAGGSLVITLVPSSDGVTAIPGVTLTSLTRRVTIKAGRSGKYTLHFKIPTTLAAGTYYPLAAVSLDGQSATAVGAIPFLAG